MKVYRASPDFDDAPRPRVSLVEVPGADVEAMQICHLVALPEPWRIRLQFGAATIDACSTVVPNTWGAAELLFLLAASLLDRVGPLGAERAASVRARVSSGERWSWDKVSGGLVGVDPMLVEGTVGEALRRIRGRIVGAWSGPESGQERSDGKEQGKKRPVRNVRTAKGKREGAAAKVPPVP